MQEGENGYPWMWKEARVVRLAVGLVGNRLEAGEWGLPR